jgi:hypothetical protein
MQPVPRLNNSAHFDHLFSLCCGSNWVVLNSQISHNHQADGSFFFSWTVYVSTNTSLLFNKYDLAPTSLIYIICVVNKINNCWIHGLIHENNSVPVAPLTKKMPVSDLLF